MKKSHSHIIIIALGSLLEWVEVSFYGYMANIIGKLFFPNYDIRTGLLLTYAVFALGYITRPIGSIIFGHIGDKFGRKPALILSMSLMSISTFCIGILPTYATIGLAAPVLLLCLRIIQSMSLSGEYSGAAIYLIERAPINQRCFMGAIVSCATGLGLVFGALISTIVKLPNMPLYAWRVPFILSCFGSILIVYMRSHLSESSEFIAAKNQITQTELPIKTVFKTEKASILYVAAISALAGAYYYVNNIFFISFLRDTVGIAQHVADAYALCGQILNVTLIFVFGKIADRINYLKFIKINIFIAIFTAPAIFYFGKIGTNFSIIIAELIYSINGAALCSCMMRIIFDQFTTTSRYTGTSVAWSIGAALIAGPSAFIAQYLNKTYPKIYYAPGIYVSIIAILTYLILFTIDNKRNSKCN